MERKIIGRYIVADPRICHGELTYRGSRVMVRDVLNQLAKGRAWETIVGSWGGSVTKEAIAETLRLAAQAFLDHADEYVVESIPV